MAADRHPGLTTAEATYRLKKVGPNVLPTVCRPSPVILLARQLVHFFALKTA